MASFKHDEAGFLLGELVKSGSEQGRIQRAQAADLRAIRADIRKLAGGGGLRANGGSGSILKNKSSTATQREAEKSTAQAVEKGTRKAMEAIERSSKSAPRAKAEPPPAKKEAPATIERTARLQAQQQAKAQAAQAKRDGKGRFTKGGGKDDSEDGGAGLRESSGLFKRLEGLASIGSNANQLDPALTAANEVREAVAPIGRGLSTLFGGESDRKKERWYKRIWKELKDGNKAQANAPRGGGGGGGLGAMGLMRLFGMGAAGGGFGATIAAFLAKIPAALGFILTRIFAPIAGIIAAWNVGQWLGTKIYEWLEKTGIGPAIFDPIFRAVDGFIESAQNGWDKLNKGLGDVVDGIKSIPDKLGSFFTGLDDAMRGLPVVGDVYAKAADALKGAKDATVETVKEVKQAAATTASEAGLGYQQGKSGQTQAPAASLPQAAGRVVGGAVGAVKSVAKSAIERWNGGAKNDIVNAANTTGVDAGLLASIAHFESGFNADAAPIAKDATKNRVRQHDGRMAISSAHGYGQFIDGSWQGALNKWGSKYGVQGAGKLTKDQANAMRGDKRLQALMLGELTKENIEKGRALGGKDDAANVYAFHNLGGGDASKLLKAMRDTPGMSVRDALLAGTQDAKEIARVDSVIKGNKSLYGDGSISAQQAYGRMGDAMKGGEVFAKEARAAQGSISTAPAISAGVSAAAPFRAQPAMPPAVPAKLPPPAEVPQTVTQLNTAKSEPVPVNVTLPERIGQNVGDRNIAHIVTGGLGA
ncbi:hypothetical protein [Comamonas sp. HJ-2]